jgi:ATP-dependent Zn protease
MKTVKVTIAAAILFVTMFTTSAFATKPNSPKPNQVNYDGIKEMVEENLIKNAYLFDEATTINLEFIVNENNEVIITTTNNKDYDASLKQIFNYQKVSGANWEKNQIYTLMVTVQ